ncbi:MAG: hypothetical protein WCB36_01290 [Burkholderiales bacterium]
MKYTAILFALLVGAASFSASAIGTRPIAESVKKPLTISIGTRPVTK